MATVSVANAGVVADASSKAIAEGRKRMNTAFG